jgi:hypothetical protein
MTDKDVNFTVEHGTATVRDGALRELEMEFDAVCPWRELRQKWAARRMVRSPLVLAQAGAKRKAQLKREMEDRAKAKEVLNRVDVLEEACRALLAGRQLATSPKETIARLVAAVSASGREAEAPCSGCPFLATRTATTSSRGRIQVVRK